MEVKVTLKQKGDGPHCELYLDDIEIGRYVRQIDVHQRAGGRPQLVLRINANFEIEDLPMDVQLIFEKLQTVEEAYEERKDDQPGAELYDEAGVPTP